MRMSTRKHRRAVSVPRPVAHGHCGRLTLRRAASARPREVCLYSGTYVFCYEASSLREGAMVFQQRQEIFIERVSEGPGDDDRTHDLVPRVIIRRPNPSVLRTGLV